jgi:hypothetical protein
LQRLVLPVLAAIGFALTVGITMRHQELQTLLRPDSAIHAQSLSATTSLSTPSEAEVPVRVVVNKLPDGAERVDLRNLSAEPLLVTINVSGESAPNKFIAQVPVAAADVTRLYGLPASPGDRITLASRGYRDQVTRVD